MNYSYYPAFVEYPGSTSLTLETSRDMIVEICRGLARFGPKRFYVLNTGVSTASALKPAAAALAAEGILMRYTDVLDHHGRRRGEDLAAGRRHACRRDRDLDDALHEPRGRRHEQSRQGLSPGQQGPHARSRRRRTWRTRHRACTEMRRWRRKRRAGSSPKPSSRGPSGRSRICEARRCRRPRRLSRHRRFAKIARGAGIVQR